MGKPILRSIIGLACVAGLISIRTWATHLWYDPLSDFFLAGDPVDFPDVSSIHFHGSVVVRYLLNAFLSVAFIHVIFRRPHWTRTAAWVHGIAFAVLFPVFELLLYNPLQWTDLLFWTRRLLTYPVLLFVLLAFFYQQYLLVRQKNG